jgi:hypothetical protein
LFDNAQPESAYINGVVRAGTSEILVAEIHHFAINESPTQHGQANFLEKPFKKLSHFQEEESYEIVKKKHLKDLGRFLAFLFRNPHIRFYWFANM